MTFLESCRHSVAPGQDETERLLRFCAGVQLWLGYNFYQSGGLILGLNAKGERLRHWANLVKKSESFQLWHNSRWNIRIGLTLELTASAPTSSVENKALFSFFRFLVRTLWKTLVNPPAWLLYSFLKSSKDHVKPIILYLVGKGTASAIIWQWESHINENLQQPLSLIAWALPPCAE